jgi:energy-coupling factor transporter ATP-binding protein EcfA2
VELSLSWDQQFFDPIELPGGRRLGEAINLTFRAGHPTALVGASGTGKTTLLKQIAGWIGADHDGQFVGDGVVMLGGYRRAVSHLCLHDAAILSDTVRENLFAPGASDAECWLALAAVELDGRVAGGWARRLDQSGCAVSRRSAAPESRSRAAQRCSTCSARRACRTSGLRPGFADPEAGAVATDESNGHLFEPRRVRRARNN